MGININDELNNLAAVYDGNTFISAVTAADYRPRGKIGECYDGISVQNAFETTTVLKSNWDYGVTLNEDDIKVVVEKITKERELAKITPNDGPEIPKWTGFLPI